MLTKAQRTVIKRKLVAEFPGWEFQTSRSRKGDKLKIHILSAPYPLKFFGEPFSPKKVVEYSIVQPHRFHKTEAPADPFRIWDIAKGNYITNTDYAQEKTQQVDWKVEIYIGRYFGDPNKNRPFKDVPNTTLLMGII